MKSPEQPVPDTVARGHTARRSVVIAGVELFAAVFATVGLWRFFNPRPMVLATADSPDGRFRCIISEQKPPHIKDSP